MKRHVFIVVLAGMSGPVVAAQADTPEIGYGKPAAWVAPVPAPTTAATPPDAPVRIIYVDNQVRVGPDGEEAFTAYRMKILKPEALTAGNVTISWVPAAGPATVHYVRVIREGRTIDTLATTKFQVLQREAGLERSMLDGELTATLQVPGLQVGDELEFASTVTRREPAFGDHVAGVGQLPVLGMPGAFRYRVLWPATQPLKWQATPDLPPIRPTAVNGDKQLVFELRDPSGSVPTEGAPPRYNVRRVIEYSDFADWSDVSRQIWPMFDKAAQLTPASPLHAEVARIAAASKSPGERAQAALRLVQDGIRYVYVGLDGGNYRPASADETWQRRFGDCKAKTVLLLALLRDLGITAEPVLVNLAGGDGVNDRLPSPRMFDHVLVRAHVDGKAYWLDGTRLGDRYLDMIPAPAFRWALPLGATGGDLSPVTMPASDVPQYVGVVDIDARAGFGKDATVTAQNVLRGDEAFQLRSQIAALSPDDADRAIRSYWRQQLDWVEPDQVGWTYDERRASIILRVAGHGTPGWTGDQSEGRSLTLLGAGFYAPDAMRRPKEQDQAAPWAVDYPRFRCWATTVRLPPADAKWAWTYAAKPVDRRLGGVAYWRAAGLKGGVMRTVMSRRSNAPEVSPAAAVEHNAQLASFDNNMSSVYQTAVGADTLSDAMQRLPFSDDADWVANPSACMAPVTGGASRR